VQSEKTCDKDDDDDDADDVENVHWILRLRHVRFRYESTALQQETSRSASKFRLQVSSVGLGSYQVVKVVNFIQTDLVNGLTIDSVELSP
jgi:hypothetical protein